MLNYIESVLVNMPKGWLDLTTHRLDIYNERLAKTQFLEQFEILFNNNNFKTVNYSNLSAEFLSNSSWEMSSLTPVYFISSLSLATKSIVIFLP